MSNSYAQIVGDWNGVLKVEHTQMSIIFHIIENDGVYTATLDSPDQGAKGIPADETSFENNELKITVNAAITYVGKYDASSNTIKGNFEQGGMSIPLNLSKEEVKKEINARKQEPKDYPYVQEEVEVKNEVADVVLAGTLTMPKDKKMKQVVILISGSGAQDRNADLGILNHRPFLVWSDYLTRNGIAVLRYDDRGIAKSTGDFSKATSADFANDAEAIVTYLQSREDMKDVKIGLMGHSEGGMVAPMVAARNKAVDFVVLLAGPGIATSELLLTDVTHS